MLSRREKLLILPWQEQRYKNHKRNIQSAKSVIDVKSPPEYSHITNKLKKLQSENERLNKIKKENVRLLQSLSSIMSTKRLENFWSQSRINFLNREKLNMTKSPKRTIISIEMKRNKSTHTKKPANKIDHEVHASMRKIAVPVPEGKVSWEQRFHK